MKVEKRLLSVAVLVSLLAFSMFASLASAASVVSISYAPFTDVSGVIEKDRFDFMNADGNPLKEDIANAVFQGPGVFGSDSVGYMKDVYLTVTKYGTLSKMNYTGEETTPYHWLPVIEQDAVGTPYGVKAPVEGWVIAYNLTVFPATFPADEGYLVVTFSGFSDGTIIPGVIGKDANDNWALSVTKEVWVNNPRLLAIYYEVIAANNGSPYTPVFKLQLIVVFNKATKFIEIFQNLKLVSINIFGCQTVNFNMALGRMAIFDANPYCDRAFYGWKNVKIADPEFFLVLSWTNSTLSKWVRSDLGWDYYGAYMASYPIPDSWAIASTWYDSNDTDTLPEAANVWHATQLRYTNVTLKVGTTNPLAGMLDKYVFLHMGDIDLDQKGDGDQALTRVEWYADKTGALPEKLVNLTTGWKMVMYGVYDVGETYDGGEGGWFDYGYLCLSSGDVYEDDISEDYAIVPVDIPVPPIIGPPTEPWTHTGTLGWLNEPTIELTEDSLCKVISYLDLNQDGSKEEGEYDIKYDWWPTEELWWQLTYKFAPPVFSKIPPSTCCMFNEGGGEGEGQYDFMVLPSPGATPDAAGAAWLNARFTSMLVTFDVESYNMIATVGYTNPATKMLPYLMLRLNAIPTATEDYPARKAHYLTTDGRAFPQMEWEDRVGHCETPWLDKHYLLVTVAGVHPNLATYYFNDFTPIVRAIGGDYQWQIVILPTIGPIDIGPYVGTDMGLGVIALAKDHFNNIALIVYGLDAQDTYWTAFIATHDWNEYLIPDWGDWQAVLIDIDYTETGKDWGVPGMGIPTAHPSYGDLWWYSWVLYAATEYEAVEAE